MRNETSVFVAPDYDIDERLYFSDINISKLPIMTEYESLISQSRFDDAISLIEDEDFYGAWLLNLLEDRLIKMEDYVWDLVKPVFGSYQSTEPEFTEEPEIYIWIDSSED